MTPAGERTALDLFDAARARCPDHVALEVPPAAGAQHSVVMKRERLEPGAAYEGVPTREVARPSPRAQNGTNTPICPP